MQEAIAIDRGEAAEHAARDFGVSARYVHDAAFVKNAFPERFDNLKHGEITITQAKVIRGKRPVQPSGKPSKKTMRPPRRFCGSGCSEFLNDLGLEVARHGLGPKIRALKTAQRRELISQVAAFLKEKLREMEQA